jgi:hypothetical protein
VRFRTAHTSQLSHKSEKTKGKVLPISFESDAVRLNASLRVRLHGRNRLPERALTMSLATVGLLFGASLVAPASGSEGRFDARTETTQVIEMRSAATSDTFFPARRDVRVIQLDGAIIDGG